MSLIQKEIDKVISAIQVPAPIFELKDRGGSINLTPRDKVKCAVDSPIKDTIMSNIDFDWDNVKQRYVGSGRNMISRIRSNIASGLTDYVKTFSDSKNPRLTTIYQWYSNCLNDRAIADNPDLEDLVYESWKYLGTGSARNEAFRKNAVAILEVIKQKFESRGVKR